MIEQRNVAASVAAGGAHLMAPHHRTGSDPYVVSGFSRTCHVRLTADTRTSGFLFRADRRRRPVGADGNDGGWRWRRLQPSCERLPQPCAVAPRELPVDRAIAGE